MYLESEDEEELMNMNSNLDFDYNLAGKKSLMKEDEKEYVLAEVSAEYEDEMGKGIFNFRKM